MAKPQDKQYKTEGFQIAINGTTVYGCFLNVVKEDNSLTKWGLTPQEFFDSLQGNEVTITKMAAKAPVSSPFK